MDVRINAAATASKIPTRTFKRGDRVIYTDRQGVTTSTVIRRVVLMRAYNDPKRIVARYYALDGIGFLTTDGLEAA